MLEEDDVIIGPGCGDRVPHALERPFEIVGLDGDLEDAEFVRFPDLGARQRGAELHTSLAVTGSIAVHQQHVDRERLHD